MPKPPRRTIRIGPAGWSYADWNGVFYPGIDLKIADNITVRPTGIAGATQDAVQWGLGVGLAMTF